MRLAARSKAARSSAARSTVVFALDGCELDGGAAALDGGVLDGGTLDCGTLDGGARFFDTLSSGTLTFDHSQETCSGAVVWSTAARSARHALGAARARRHSTLDGGTLDGGPLNGGARSTAMHARRRHARASTAAQLQTDGVLQLLHRAASITVVTRRRRDHAPRRRRVTFAFPVGGRQLCTSRIIHFRVASPAVTSVGTSSRILRQKQPPSTPTHPHCRPSTSTTH